MLLLIKRFVVCVAGASLVAGCVIEDEPELDVDSETQEIFGPHGCDDLPPFLLNNWPIHNDAGFSATYSTDGFVDLGSEFATPQGTNGRDCTSCHSPFDGWGFRPATAERLFDCTDGLHPVFNCRDANARCDSDVSTVEARRESFSMVLQGKFVRNRALPASREFDCVDFDDPFGFGNCERLHRFRKSMPTANFRTNGGFNWHNNNSLESQVVGNITGAQQGDTPSEELIDEIVAFEDALTHAQIWVSGAGLTMAGGANGGPQAHASQAIEVGPFDLFDAWADSPNPWRRQIARGQELFNDGDVNGRRCGGCHNSKNNGNNVNGSVFDVGAADDDVANADMATYTLRNRDTGEERTVTDPGRAMRTGLWSDIGRFKTPNLRGLASRAPYFHASTAETLEEVIEHYEIKLGFDFTDQEEADLIAFLNAL